MINNFGAAYTQLPNSGGSLQQANGKLSSGQAIEPHKQPENKPQTSHTAQSNTSHKTNRETYNTTISSEQARAAAQAAIQQSEQDGTELPQRGSFVDISA